MTYPHRLVPFRVAYQQLLLLRVADQLNVGQRFRKTVRMEVVPFLGTVGAYDVVLERHALPRLYQNVVFPSSRIQQAYQVCTRADVRHADADGLGL